MRCHVTSCIGYNRAARMYRLPHREQPPHPGGPDIKSAEKTTPPGLSTRTATATSITELQKLDLVLRMTVTSLLNQKS